MANPRHPTRLLDYTNKALAYPQELMYDNDGYLYIKLSDSDVQIKSDQANKLSGAVTVNVGGVTADPITFQNAGDNVTIQITDVPVSLVTGLSDVATTGAYTDLSGAPAAATMSPRSPGTATVGSSSNYAREDHIHPLQTTITGNAGSATKLNTARSIAITGVTSTPATFDGTANVTIPITEVPVTIVTGLADVATTGAYSDIIGGPTASLAAPLPLGENAEVGSSDNYSREDHVHPIQYNIPGNAATATALLNPRNIAISGAVVGSAQFDGTQDVTINVAGVSGGEITGIVPLTSGGTGADTYFDALVNLKALPKIANLYDNTSSIDIDNITDTAFIIPYTLAKDCPITSNTMLIFQFFGGSDATVSSRVQLAMPFITTGGNNSIAVRTATPNGDFTGIVWSAWSKIGEDTNVDLELLADSTNPVANSALKTIIDTINTQLTALDTDKLAINDTAASATKLDTARSIGLSGVTATPVTFDGSADITIEITSIPTSIIAGSLASTTTYNATIGTTWTGDAAPYTQVINIAGITETDNPIVDMVPDADYTVALDQMTAFSRVYRVVTSDGFVTVYATKTTTVEVPIQLKCVR